MGNQPYIKHEKVVVLLTSLTLRIEHGLKISSMNILGYTYLGKIYIYGNFAGILDLNRKQQDALAWVTSPKLAWLESQDSEGQN